MKLTCLGKYGPYPAAGGASTGYLLQAGGTNLLLDCGAGVFARMLQHCTLDELDAVLLSHLHTDHCSDMRILRQALNVSSGNTATLDAYLPASPQAGFDDIASSTFVPHVIAQDEAVRIGDIAIRFVRTNHPIECYAMRMEHGGKTLVFTGDSNVCEALPALAAQADVLLCDAAFFHRDWAAKKPHYSARLAAELAAEAQVGQLLLTHIMPQSDEQALLAEATDVFARSSIVQEGQVYPV